MRKALKIFLPYNDGQDIFLKFHNFKQKIFLWKIIIMMKCDVGKLEEQTIDRYLGRLQLEIDNIVQLQPYWTYNDVAKLAFKVEKKQKEAHECRPRFGAKDAHFNRGCSLVLKVSAQKFSMEKTSLNSQRIKEDPVQVTKILIFASISNAKNLIILLLIDQIAKSWLLLKKNWWKKEIKKNQ